MQQRLQAAGRVPFLRGVMVALTLTVLPSFGVAMRSSAQADAAEAISAPAIVETAAVAASATSVESTAAASNFDSGSWDETTIGSVDPKIFELALGAARCAVKSGTVGDPSTLTVIDYSKPSTTNRLWVYDLRTRELLYEELVAHGQGSGGNLATMFSNEDNTHRTSIGLFVTEDTYVGKNGYSLRMNGLDAGFNDRARQRAIVMHGAPYVNAEIIKAQGRLGRSWGCPALREAVAHKVIDTVKGGGLVFSYYPDENWLKTSRYLGDCAAAN